MNRDWVDEKVEMLAVRLRGSYPRRVDSREFFFEPTDDVYGELESGDERDLQCVVSRVAMHLEIMPTPTARYDWGLKMEPDVAGRIRRDLGLGYIQVPFFYVGKRYSMGGILAHELTHALMGSRGVWLDDSHENELLTDLGAVFVGLGKLLLNGYLDEGGGLGYLSPDLIAYCLKKVCRLHAIDAEAPVSGLTVAARALVERHWD